MQSTKLFLVVGVLAAVLLGVGFYYWNTGSLYIPGIHSVSTTTSVGNIEVEGEGENLKIISVENPSVPQPTLERTVTVKEDIPAQVAEQLRANIQILITELEKDNMRLNLWLELGNNLYIAGDIEGAEEVWKYITQVAPSHFLAYSSLGDLYMHSRKDYPQAETNLKKAVELNPAHIDGYRNLFMLYHYLYKTDTDLDGDILGAGLKANPDHPDLLQLLGEYQGGR